jgi:hypothetical protein
LYFFRAGIMSNKNTKKNESGGGHVAHQKRERAKRPTAKMLAYALLTGSGLPKRHAAKLAGYNQSTSKIERSESFRAIQSVADQLDQAADIVGVTQQANLETLGQIAYDPENDNTSRIQSVKVINDMMGWKKPEQVQVNQNVNVGVLIGLVRSQGANLGELIRSNMSTK